MFTDDVLFRFLWVVVKKHTQKGILQMFILVKSWENPADPSWSTLLAVH